MIKNIISIRGWNKNERTGKRHSDLIRDIEKYIQAMQNSQNAKLRYDNFFIESNYKSGTGKE